MAHELDLNMFPGSINMGQAALALALTGAWHNLGTIFDHAMSMHEAISIAFPWTADKEQLQRPSTGQMSNRYGIYRSDNGFELGTASGKYELIQPIEMFSPQFKYESAGALFGGSVLFCTARVGEFAILGSQDVHKSYLVFLNSFDGTVKAQQFLTTIRIVCNNTKDIALRNKLSSTLSYKHTKNVHFRVDESRVLLEAAINSQEEIQKTLEMLATKKMTRETTEIILNELFPGESKQSDNKKQEIMDLFRSNDGDAFPEWKTTAYSLFNSVTNYVDHSKPTSVHGLGVNAKGDKIKPTLQETGRARLESAVLGDGAKLKEKALVAISKMAELLPTSTTYYSTGDNGSQTTTMVLDTPIPEVIDITALDISSDDSRPQSDTPNLDAILAL